MGREAAFKVCETLHACPLVEKDKKEYTNTSISPRSYPKIDTGQDTVICDSRKRRPVTFSMSNRLFRKCLVILLQLLCHSWVFITTASVHGSNPGQNLSLAERWPGSTEEAGA